jgi:hypothetical protein
MRKSLSIAALALTATLALSACGSQNAVTPGNGSTPSESTKAPVTAPTADPIPTDTPVAEDGPVKNERGNIVTAFGDTGTISSSASGAVQTKFTVHSIKPIACTGEFAQAPQNGKTVAVDITVETTKELAKDSYPKFTLSGYDFKYIGANGTTFNGNLATTATYSCIPDSETFPSDGLGPSEKTRAKIILDVPATKGLLVLKSGLSGFEYKF